MMTMNGNKKRSKFIKILRNWINISINARNLACFDFKVGALKSSMTFEGNHSETL
jgi:hypothetical protein